MTTDQNETGTDLGSLTSNLARIEELSQRLVAALAHKEAVRPSLQAPGQELYLKAAGAYMAEMLSNPAKLFEHQISFWGETLKNAVETQQALALGEVPEHETSEAADPRFASPLWDSNPYFHFLKHQYLAASEAVTKTIDELDGLDARDKNRIAYFSRQIIDMLAPTNFLSTNPEALTKAIETEGQSLVDGLENLVRDIEAHDGELLVTLSDKDAFKVGGNLATTPGEVVFRNRMFELIQYSPVTETVHATPLIIFPPWINKFYILDMKEQNSLIRWVTEQGFTLFVVSWVNPDASYADVGIDTYVEEGFLTAIDEVKKITGEKQVNVVGYCIAGTTLSLTLALMKKRGDKSVKSATFFTALTDFSDPGEVGAFLDDDFVNGIEDEVTEAGYLDSKYMSRTFSFLRANDLIYRPAIKSYMLGEAPPAFDLLYWNGDSTNLPARMAVEYLRGLCQRNEFATAGFQLLGESLSIKDVTVPVCAIACETDHIAPWKSSYGGFRRMGSRNKTFILSESGHIAGIVNPPSKKKYGHYTNDSWDESPEAWLQGATFHEGSWWGRWESWLSKRSGKQVPAREPGDSSHKPLAPAPGTYVVAKPNT